MFWFHFPWTLWNTVRWWSRVRRACNVCCSKENSILQEWKDTQLTILEISSKLLRLHVCFIGALGSAEKLTVISFLKDLSRSHFMFLILPLIICSLSQKDGRHHFPEVHYSKVEESNQKLKFSCFRKDESRSTLHSCMNFQMRNIIYSFLFNRFFKIHI